PSSSPPVVVRFTVSMPQNLSLYLPGTSPTCSTITLSPDGKLLAYVTFGGNQPQLTQLFLRSMDTLESKLVSGTEVITGGPIFSPDGEWLAFGANGKLKKLSKDGGAPVAIADIANCWLGGAWSTADDIILRTPGNVLVRTPASGGTPPQVFIEA